MDPAVHWLTLLEFGTLLHSGREPQQHNNCHLSESELKVKLRCLWPAGRHVEFRFRVTSRPRIKRDAFILNEIKLCPKGTQTCVLPLFCDRDIEINRLTLKLKGDIDILKMYLYTENEATTLKDLKLRA